MIAALVQLAASLVGIILLWLLARGMGLGGDPRLRDEETARRLADETVCGFNPTEIAIDRAGIGALLRDSQGRVMLLRRHGNRFAGRLLDSGATARLNQNFLTVTPSDRWFGTVTLDLGAAAQVWAGSFRRLGAAA